MIVDTSFLIDLLRAVPSAVAKAREFEVKKERVSTTTVTVFELWRGSCVLSEKKRAQLEELISALIVYPFLLPEAKEAGLIAGFLSKEGRSIDPEDCMVAGVARVRKEAVLTRNIEHFKRVPDLIVEGY